MKCRVSVLSGLVLVALASVAGPAGAQGVTTSGISGIVTDAQGLVLPGVTVVAVHNPSGTKYSSVSQTDGRFSIQGMRVGGPYTVSSELSGFQSQTRTDIDLPLGVTIDVPFKLGVVAMSEEVTVVATSDHVFSSARTGAATTVPRTALESLPTLEGRLSSFVRLTPQSTGGMSFAGQDNRLNNITVDGSSFNNSFGLGGAPGDRTGVAPISVQAIEQVQVNIAPYDIRQGNFVGAGVNTVTRSGTNRFRGSAYFQYRDQDFVGTKAGGETFVPGKFEYKNYGGWGGGPLKENSAFYFVNLEDDATTEPGTNFRANKGGEPVGGQTTRVQASDLDALSAFLDSRFSYQTGVYQGYEHQTPARRFLAKSDINLSRNNKLSLRYNHLDSSTDVLLSTSSSLGFGSRRGNTNGLNFRNSNYKILENIRSFIGELNTVLGSSSSNTLIAGYTSQDESRDSLGTFFPMADILDGSSVYTTFGFEPFTPNNELRYSTFQFQDHFTMYRRQHRLTFGGGAERYESENVFFPGSQSIYVYNSLADFYTDANDQLANPNRTTSPVTLRRFQVRWMNIPGLEKPVQPLEVWSISAYVQDEWRPTDRLTLTLGVRADVPVFGDTAFENPNADALVFRDGDGNPKQYSTGKLPDTRALWSPRIGFNWAPGGDQQTQLRGGTGVFTGRPAYVWISNQIGNTGVLTGFEQLENTRARPFHPDPHHYKPANVTGAPATSYELALTDEHFRFPQVWRTNLAVDQRMRWGLVGTVEALVTRDVNGISYINANLAAPDARFVGADNRPRWTANAPRIHAHVANAVVLQNQNAGSAWNISGTLERAYSRGLWVKGAYSYGRARNEINPGSIAIGSWVNNPHSGDPNNPGMSYTSIGHRMFIAATYSKQWSRFGATTFSTFFEGSTGGGASYRFAGEMNNDGGTSNDMIYIHRDVSEMNFLTFTASGRTFTAAEQAQAWDAYIAQDPYLSKHRGEYAERGAATGPMSFSMDVSIAQDFIAGRHNRFQLRFDILNFNNLLNSSWGIGQSLVSSQPLTNPAVDSAGRSTYRLRVVNNELMSQSYERNPGSGDVWRMQVSLRYMFN